jgi:hypothetical protein
MQLHPHSIDMCPTSCIAYTGSYADLHSCPYVKKGKTACGIARHISLNKPTAQFTVLPVITTIQAMFANVKTANLLCHRDCCLKETISLVAAPKDVPL